MGVGVGEKYWKLEEGMNSYCVLDTRVIALDVRKCFGVWLQIFLPWTICSTIYSLIYAGVRSLRKYAEAICI